MKKRLQLFDILTGIAIILVLLGHLGWLSPYAPWIGLQYDLLYSFHMGLFMFISGFLVKYTFPKTDFDYKKYIVRKILKFVPVYLCIGILASLLKGGNFISNLCLVLVNPWEGPIKMLWYIYVLLLFYSIAPFIYRLGKKSFNWILIISVIMSLIHVTLPSYFCVDFIFKLLFFFLLGAVACDSIEKLTDVKIWTWGLLGIPFVVYLFLVITGKMTPFNGSLYIVSALISIPFFVFLSRLVGNISVLTKCLTFLSKNVFYIYLWQMFTIRLVRMISEMFFVEYINSISSILFIIISILFTIPATIFIGKTYDFFFKKLCGIFQRKERN